VTNAAGNPALLTFWQHTGLIVSTRQAEAFLQRSEGGGQRTEDRGQRAEIRRVSCDGGWLLSTASRKRMYFLRRQAWHLFMKR
jgi:hypothetical protein